MANTVQPIQVTFGEKNGESRIVDVQFDAGRFRKANVFSIQAPQFDTIGPTFNNDVIDYTISGTAGSFTLLSGIYTSINSLVDDINSVTGSELVFGTTSGNHVTVTAQHANTKITPSFLTLMLGFEDSQFSGDVPVTPNEMIANNLGIIFPFTGIVVESNKIPASQWVVIDGKYQNRGFYMYPLGGWDMVLPMTTVFDKNSLGIALDSEVSVTGGWWFLFSAVGIDGALYNIDFGNANPVVSVMFS